MLPFALAALLAAPAPDHPALVARIGTQAFRPHPAWTLMATSPDGSRLYTADIPMRCRGEELTVDHMAVVDAATGRVLASYPSPWWSSSDCYEFGDGELWLFVRKRDQPTAFLRVVDLNTGRVVREGKPWKLPGMGFSITEARMPDGGARPIFHDRKTTALLDPETGAAVALDSPLPDEFPSAKLSADGQLLAADLRDGSIRIYDARTGKLRRTITTQGEKRYFSQFLPGGLMTVWVGDRARYSFDILDADGKRVRRLFENQLSTLRTEFDPTGKTFLHQPWPKHEGADYPPLEIRDAGTNQVIGRLPRDLPLARFDRTGKTIWAQGRALVPFDAATGEMKASAPNPPGYVVALAFRGDDQLVGLASGLVLAWDAKTGRELSRSPVPAGWSAKFNAAGDKLLFTEDGKPVAWDALTGAVRPTADVPPEPFHWRTQQIPGGTRSIAVTPAGGEPGYIAGDAIEILDRTNPNAAPARFTIPHSVPKLTGTALGPDGKAFAVVGYRTVPRDGYNGHEVVLSLFDLQARTRITESTLDLHHADMFGFSPDGRLFAVGDSQKVLLLDAATGKVRGTVYPRRLSYFYPGRVCWSPNSKLLALTAPDSCVEIWDVAKVVGR